MSDAGANRRKQPVCFGKPEIKIFRGHTMFYTIQVAKRSATRTKRLFELPEKPRTRARVSLYEVGDWWLQMVFQLKKYNAPLRDQEKML